MTYRALAVLAAALAASPAPAAQVDLVPDSGVLSITGAGAAPIAPLPLGLFPAAASAEDAPIPWALPAPAAAAPAPTSTTLAAAPAAPAAAASPSRAAHIPGASRPTLLQTASAPLPDVSRLTGDGASASAERDFAARAQLDAPDAGGDGVLAEAAVPAAVQGREPLDARRMASTVIPEWIREELPVTAAKLGRALPPDYAADVLARSKVWVYAWHSRWTYEISGGLPDGHYDPKFGIRVMLKRDWRKLKDPETHFRVLFAHEYTHWLQQEGLVTRRFGGEIPAVAVEQLRAEELVGREGMKAGRVGFIAEGNVANFESGREWARGDMRDESQLYFRGTLGGAAYEVGRIAGRPEAAWEFLNLVIAEKGGLKPREAFERVTGRRK